MLGNFRVRIADSVHDKIIQSDLHSLIELLKNELQMFKVPCGFK